MTQVHDDEVSFPRSLSPSRVGDYRTCPLLYRFRVIDRLPEAPAPAAIMGTLMHAALEDIFDLPREDRTPESALELFEQAFLELQDTDPESAAAVLDRLGSAPDLVASYFALEDPTRLEPHAREFGFEAPLSESFSIRGYVDRVDRAPDGRIRIVDYKTGKSPNPRFADKAMFQMRFYALAWWRIHGEIPTVLQLLYLGNGEILKYAPSEGDLLRTQDEIESVRDSINASARALEFIPTPSKLCDWCDHQSRCPAKGGTPPPLPPRDEWNERSAVTKR